VAELAVDLHVRGASTPAFASLSIPSGAIDGVNSLSMRDST